MANSPHGRIVVLAGPTAVGKGTVVRCVLERLPDVWLSVSATTRAPRPDEVEGDHYYFLTDTQFDDLVDNDGLLEWATVHGAARYGTPRAAVEEQAAAGRPVLMELDLQGARQVRAALPEALLVFLKPPSWEELERRLVGRGTEDAAARARRLETARVELAAQDEFDEVIVNDELSKACDELVNLLSPGASPDFP